MKKELMSEPRYEAKYHRWRITVTLNGKQHSFYSTLPSAVKAKAECRRKAQAFLDHADLENIRFGEAWERFIEAYARKNRQTSVNAVMARAKAHLLPRFAMKKVLEISKRDWQAVIDDAYKAGAKSSKTLKGIATTIRTFCKWCAEHGYMDDHDVPLYFDYPIGATTKPKHILQPDELNRLFDPAQDDADWCIPMWRFLVLTGLRRGELCALQKTRDFNGQSITIRESISHEGIVTSGKTANAERTIYLAPLAMQQLEDHRDRLRARGLDDLTDYLFCGEDGRRLSPRSLRNHWQKWREKNGISLTIHELRHTFISYSRLRTEISLEDLKELYGHSDKMNTEKVYVHEITKSPEEVRAEQEKAKREAVIIDSAFLSLISRDHGEGML